MEERSRLGGPWSGLGLGWPSLLGGIGTWDGFKGQGGLSFEGGVVHHLRFVELEAWMRKERALLYLITHGRGGCRCFLPYVYTSIYPFLRSCLFLLMPMCTRITEPSTEDCDLCYR